MICNTGDETTEHSLLTCNTLEETRCSLLDRLVRLAGVSLQFAQDNPYILTQLILDCSRIEECNDSVGNQSQLRPTERQSISLCYILHT